MSEGVMKKTLSCLIGIGVSFILWMTGLGLPLFIFPLLLVTLYQGEREGLISFGIEAVAILAYSFLMSPYPETVPEISTFLILAESYVPLSLLAAGAIWITAKRLRLEARLGVSMVPAAVYLLFLGIAAGRDPALFAGLSEHYGNVFETLVGMIMQTPPDQGFMELFMDIFLWVTLSTALPITACFACASLFLYESSLHSRDSEWENRVMSLELDGRLIWAFIASFALAILMRFVSLPRAIGAVLFNVALSLLILYFIEGFSVLYYWIRKISRMKSTSLFLMLAMLILLAPGINIIIVLGLPLLGMAETFFDLRK